jgi:hypothetical protein
MSHPVSPDVHHLVADAIAAIRSGDKARGQTLLTQALRLNPQHETAWLWMASLVETPERRRECLERALAINPHNETARRALRALSEPQSLHATPNHASAPDQTLHPSPTSVHEYVQTATQANGAQDDQARHCPHCGAPLETTATFCAFCKSPLALPSDSDAPLPPKRAPLTDEERKRLETDKNTRDGIKLSFMAYIVPFAYFFDGWLPDAICDLTNNDLAARTLPFYGIRKPCMKTSEPRVHRRTFDFYSSISLYIPGIYRNVRKKNY